MSHEQPKPHTKSVALAVSGCSVGLFILGLVVLFVWFIRLVIRYSVSNVRPVRLHSIARWRLISTQREFSNYFHFIQANAKLKK